MFLIKKIIGTCLMPLTFSPLLLAVGLLLTLRSRRHRRLGQILCGCALACGILTSYDPLATALLGPLEHRYPAFEQPDQPLDYVIVLGGGHRWDVDLPITSRVSKATIFRLCEGIRIMQLNPGCRLIVDGFAWRDSVSHALAAARFAMAMGVDSSRIIVEPTTRDTEEEAQVLGALVRGSRCALVTTASHMPRSLLLFRRQGVEPLPAPTEHETSGWRHGTWLSLPNAVAARKTEIALHEYFGMLWSFLRGKL